ncbi:hypothetical protein OG453_43870 [Streptomyces sp. NBC_01381]|uniref:hypothetical protein n=1 Tax=Streptomyces sp. NBC_01381 TaxID=2903845 RepID=UPI00225616CB|nr:hypothetical protein [Streptomyces sp. NBC_01381]MCX4673501.1 hypothetical protein [Streptomyces sp. NBC_01381]
MGGKVPALSGLPAGRYGLCLNSDSLAQGVQEQMTKKNVALGVAIMGMAVMTACGPADGESGSSDRATTGTSSANELIGARKKIFFNVLENTKNKPSGVSDEELVSQGNAVCAADGNGGVGGAIGSAVNITRETKKKLDISYKDAVAVVGAARAACKAQP